MRYTPAPESSRASCAPPALYIGLDRMVDTYTNFKKLWREHAFMGFLLFPTERSKSPLAQER
jgi:hypothetical protein